MNSTSLILFSFRRKLHFLVPGWTWQCWLWTPVFLFSFSRHCFCSWNMLICSMASLAIFFGQDLTSGADDAACQNPLISRFFDIYWVRAFRNATRVLETTSTPHTLAADGLETHQTRRRTTCSTEENHTNWQSQHCQVQPGTRKCIFRRNEWSTSDLGFIFEFYVKNHPKFAGPALF